MTYPTLDEGATPTERNLHDALQSHDFHDVHVGGDHPTVQVTLDGTDARRLTEILREAA